MWICISASSSTFINIVILVTDNDHNINNEIHLSVDHTGGRDGRYKFRQLYPFDHLNYSKETSKKLLEIG